MAYFFNRFFFFISLGTLMAVTVLVYIQDEVSRSWVYGICAASMVIAIVVFLSGTQMYRYKKSTESPIVHILQVVVAAWRKRKMGIPHDVNLLFEDKPEMMLTYCLKINQRARESITQTSSSKSSYRTGKLNIAKQVMTLCVFFFFSNYSVLDKAAIVAQGDLDNNGSVPNPWKLCSVTRVEEVKMMVRLLPIWAITILFWTTYAQMITFSVEQASTMNRSIGKFQIPAGALTVFLVAAVLITLAVYDRFIMPFWKKWKGQQGKESKV